MEKLLKRCSFSQTIQVLLDGRLLEPCQTICVPCHQNGRYTGRVGHHLQTERPNTQLTGPCKSVFVTVRTILFIINIIKRW